LSKLFSYVLLFLVQIALNVCNLEITHVFINDMHICIFFGMAIGRRFFINKYIFICVAGLRRLIEDKKFRYGTWVVDYSKNILRALQVTVVSTTGTTGHTLFCLHCICNTCWINKEISVAMSSSYFSSVHDLHFTFVYNSDIFYILYDKHPKLKEPPLRSGRVILSKTCFFLLSTGVGHSTLPCGTLICILSVCNSLKTCIIYVYHGKALVTLFPVQQIRFKYIPSCEIDRGYIKAPQISVDTLNTSATWKYMFSKKIFSSVFNGKTSVDSL